MTFNPNIPQSGDKQDQSQPQILTNFTQLNTLMDNDHVAWDNGTVANRARHRRVRIVENQTDPNLSYPNTEIYTKSYNLTPNRDQILFFDRVHEDGTDIVTPIMPLAMVKFDSAGAISKQVNVSSVTSAVGNFNVNFTKPMPDTNYIPQVNYRRGASDLFVSLINSSTSVLNIQFRNSGGSLTNPSDVYCIVWGF